MNIGRTNAYSVSNAALAKKAANAENVATEKVAEKSEGKDYKQLNSLDILNAMDAMGRQNINGLNLINPAKYLSPERIADIQASMGKFDNGVSAHKKAMDDELAGTSQYENLSEADKLALAAHAFSLSEE